MKIEKPWKAFFVCIIFSTRCANNFSFSTCLIFFLFTQNALQTDEIYFVLIAVMMIQVKINIFRCLISFFISTIDHMSNLMRLIDCIIVVFTCPINVLDFTFIYQFTCTFIATFGPPFSRKLIMVRIYFYSEMKICKIYFGDYSNCGITSQHPSTSFMQECVREEKL